MEIYEIRGPGVAGGLGKWEMRLRDRQGSRVWGKDESKVRTIAHLCTATHGERKENLRVLDTAVKISRLPSSRDKP